MLQSLRGFFDKNGRLTIQNQVNAPKSKHVIITILDDDENDIVATLSEASLARDWDKKEEEAAWEHLDQLPSL